jgi:hypothetical protein
MTSTVAEILAEKHAERDRRNEEIRQQFLALAPEDRAQVERRLFESTGIHL